MVGLQRRHRISVLIIISDYYILNALHKIIRDKKTEGPYVRSRRFSVLDS